MIKYASRDEVALHGRGTGGIVEIRNAIAQYEDASPLYGFLRYRRRNVIIKYLPENCSRLVQARVTVHFNVVCERFAPYNTTFSIAEAKELKDTKLSAACSLHTASSSTSSSTSSLRRRRLMEIAEEEEEEQRATKRQSTAKEGDDRDEAGLAGAGAGAGAGALPPVTLNSQLAKSPDESQFAGTAGTADPPYFTGAERPSSPAKSVDSRRLSSQSARPDLYSYASYPYGKPKVKLAPRPSLDVAGRPRTPGGSTGAHRPVSAIPAGFKLFSKGSRKGRGKPKSSESSTQQINEEEGPDAADAIISTAETNSISGLANLADTLDVKRPHTSGGRPTSSSGISIKSVATTVAPTVTTKHNTITPEKQRLMKAMKLREKRKKMSIQPPLPVPTVDISETAAAAAAAAAAEAETVTENGAVVAAHTSKPEEPSDGSDSAPPTGVSITGSFDDRPGSSSGLSAHNSDARNTGPGDSAIDVGLSAIDQISIDTHTSDSQSTTSPLAMSLEIGNGESTKASSLSESTDETVQAQQETKSAEMGDNGRDDPSGKLDSTNERRAITVMTAMTAATSTATTTTTTTTNTVDAVALEKSEDPCETASGGGTGPISSEEAAAVASAVDNHPQTQGKESGVGAVANQEENGKVEPETETATEAKAVPTETPLPESGPEPAALIAEEAPQEPALDRAPEDPAGPTTGSNRPTTSTTSEFTAGLQDETLTTPSTAVPTISMPEPRNSLTSTDGLEASETASSADTKLAAKRALVNTIRTDLVNNNNNNNNNNSNNSSSSSGGGGGGQGSDMARADAHLSDDDDLMEELQSATVQEAKPISVSKSPITPVFPSTSPSLLKAAAGVDNDMNRLVRTVSSPVRGSLLVPNDAAAPPPAAPLSARSVSSGAAFLQKIAQQNSANLAPKKTNIGSSISQRIKALEKLTGNPPGATSEAPSRVERPTSAFFAVRKTPGREPSRSPSVYERASSLTRDKTPSPPKSQESSPEMPRLATRERSGSVASRLSVFENFESGNPPRGRPESVQVRARIIRDPLQPYPRMPDAHFDLSDPSQLQLKQSPLVVDHQKATRTLTSALSIFTGSAAGDAGADSSASRRESIQERRMSRETRRSRSHDRSTIADDSEGGTRPRRRSSLSVVKDFITKDRRGSVMTTRSPSTENLTASPSKPSSRPPSVHAAHGLARRLSISSHRSTSKDRGDTTTSSPPPLATPLSPSLMTETSGSGGSKSRASRFMRRLSNSLSGGRKAANSTISATVAEEEEAHGAPPPSRGGDSIAQSSVVSYVGDVNVQFPDNLLWKRRTMCLDSQGFLILSTGSSDKPAGAIKRYHLSDFRLPYIPDVEVQELPNSVCLDFVEGSGLQVACEDRSGQMNVLHGEFWPFSPRNLPTSQPPNLPTSPKQIPKCSLKDIF